MERLYLVIIQNQSNLPACPIFSTWAVPPNKGSSLLPLKPASLYWHSNRIYYVVMHNFIEVKLIKETAKSNIKEGVKKLISNADPDGYCQNYDVIIKYYHLWSKDINLMGLARED